MAKVTEVTRTEEDTTNRDSATTETAPDGRNTADRLIGIIGGVLLSLLAIRVLLSFLGANRDNAFADFIYTITYPFVAPFFGLFGYEVEYGVSRLEIETLVAMVIYGLVIILIRKLIAVDRPDRTET